MSEIRIELSIIWIVVMLIFLLGDVLRIMVGDVTPGQIEGEKVGQGVYLGISIFMLLPILMVYGSIALEQSVSKWANIVIAGVFMLFNLAGLPTYEGHKINFYSSSA